MGHVLEHQPNSKCIFQLVYFGKIASTKHAVVIVVTFTAIQ